jgi:hypothetical protein
MRRIAKSHRLLLRVLVMLAAACGDDKSSGDPKADAEVVDSGISDAEPDTAVDAASTCTKIPDHYTIINAATTTEKVDKKPDLPLLKSDGTLPPLP